jgi:hypothetical protein
MEAKNISTNLELRFPARPLYPQAKTSRHSLSEKVDERARLRAALDVKEEKKFSFLLPKNQTTIPHY